MAEHKHTLQTLVERSRLLTPGRREALLKELPALDAGQQERLRTILDGEEAVIREVMEGEIEAASKRDDVKFFQGLDAFFASASSSLNKAEEPFEKTEEASKLDHFFDEA